MSSSVIAYRRKRGLIIGINKYQRDHDLLQYCINDAIDLNTILQSIDFETLLILDCNFNELKYQIDRFIETIEHNDLVLFYFAGHSKQNKNEYYLLPSDYDNCDYRRNDSDYIIDHAINIKDIMKKIDNKNCSSTIYLFDCCRLKTHIRTRSIDTNQSLTPINTKLQSLIVFACAPGKVTLDETYNKRNGSFIENLLKYITTPNQDIEGIMQQVAIDVNRQTLGVQLSYQTSSLTDKVYLVMKNDPKQIMSLSLPINSNTKWRQNGMTIAGGNKQGNQLNQLYYPEGIYVDDNNQCIYIANWGNHCIVEWKYGAKVGQVVAGENGQAYCMNQLNNPTDVIVDKNTDSLIICDRQNQRVVRWPRRNGTNGETIISDIDCTHLTMDNNGDLYISSIDKSEVRRWKIGEKEGIIVAGGNGPGNNLNQLNFPTYLFLDKDHSVYVSDFYNHRVMKWVKYAREGTVVVGGRGQGDSLTQLYHPMGVFVDHLDNVFIADSWNHRIMCWPKRSKEGRIIVGGNGQGEKANQYDHPRCLSFDRQGNLYVVDINNHRVQKFVIDLN